MGFKTKFKYEYRKFIELIGHSQIKKKTHIINGVAKHEKYDELWNKICQRIIITLFMMKPEVQQ